MQSLSCNGVTQTSASSAGPTPSLSEAAPFVAAAAAITDGIAPADPIRAMSVRRFMVGQ